MRRCNHWRMRTDGVECARCQADLAGLAAACPVCGAANRKYFASASAQATATAIAVASIGYSDAVTWLGQWHELLTSFDRLSAYYAGSPGGNNLDANRAIRNGCLAAWALAEHVPDVAGGVTYRNGHAELKDASDMINTWKHAGKAARPTQHG